MLGFTARFGSSKGMVAVPNLSGRTFDQALSDIQASGLKFKNGTIRITNNQALDKKVFAQAQTPGTLIDYESEISFNYDSYYIGAGGVSYGPIERNPVIQPVFTSPCDGTTLVRTTTYANRREVRFNNVFQFYEASANSSESSREPNSASCGYIVPPRVCPTSDVATSYWSACRQIPGTYTGTRTRSRLAIRSDCSQVPYTQTGNCCIPHVGTWTGWIADTHSRSRSRTDVIDADCNTRTIYETVCRSQCSSLWRDQGTCRNARKTQVRTCVNSSCNTYPEFRVVSCYGRL